MFEAPQPESTRCAPLRVLSLPCSPWPRHLPPPVSATSAFGLYEARYAQEGNVLHVVRRLRGANGIQPPTRIADLVGWLKTRAQDEVTYVVLRHS
jgi:hypothetical protein